MSNPLILARLEANVNSLHQLLKLQLDPFILTTRLYEAAIKGDLTSLHSLLQEDPLILDRCTVEKSDRFMQSPLHVAANLGHLELTKELLRLKPELAEQFDQLTRSSALHLAAKKGHLEVVMKLLEVSPSTCLARDQDGRNPVHIAAISNQLHVLDLLVRLNPRAAQERTNFGETILHLCVKHTHLEPLKYLVNAIGELLNVKDNDGNTVLHLAVLAKRLEIVKLLVANKKVQQNAINKNGLTPIDCLIRVKNNLNDKEIHRTLKRAKSITAKNMVKQRNIHGKWLTKQRNTLMVVASLIAGMAFQVGVNPPPFVTNVEHGSGISPTPDPGYTGFEMAMDRDGFMIANTVSLTSSLSVVLLLISGLPCKRLFVSVLMLGMWVAITSTIYTYYTSIMATCGNQLCDENTWGVMFYSTTIWSYLVATLMVGHILRLLIKPAKKLVRLVKRTVRKWRYKGLGSSSITIP